MFEVSFSYNDKVIKKARLHWKRSESIVEVLELKIDHNNKESWLPVYVKVHDKYYSARLEFIGLAAEIAYENANNTVDTSRENIFIRGSLNNGRYK